MKTYAVKQGRMQPQDIIYDESGRAMITPLGDYEPVDMDVLAQMRERVANGLDPLTGDPMQTSGVIKVVNGVCIDTANGREVTLDERGNWIYIEEPCTCNCGQCDKHGL